MWRKFKEKFSSFEDMGLGIPVTIFFSIIWLVLWFILGLWEFGVF